MKALERRYSKSERIVARAKFSPWFYLHDLNVAIILGVAIALLWIFNSQIEGFFTKDYSNVTILTDAVMKWITVGAAGVIAIIFIVISCFLYFRELIVTEDKAIYRYGCFDIHSEAIHINKIKSVEYRQSLIGQIFNYGTIYIVITDESRRRPIKGVVAPQRITKRIMEQVSKNTNERANQLVRLQLAGSVPKKKH